MNTVELKELQKKIFVDVDNIVLFVNLAKLRKEGLSGSPDSSTTSGKAGGALQKGIFSLLGKAQINIGSTEFELEEEREADVVLASSAFRKIVGPALEKEAWTELFPEAIQARTVGIVTRSLNKAGFDDLLDKPHVLAWVIYKLVTRTSPTVKSSMTTVRLEELKDFQSRVYRRYALIIKKNVNAIDGGDGSEKSSTNASFRSRLVTKLRRNAAKAYRESSNYKESENIFSEILADPQIKQELCSRLEAINPEFFEQEMEAEVVRVIAEVIPTQESNKSQCNDKEIELFAQITEMIVNQRITSICHDHDLQWIGHETEDGGSHPNGLTSDEELDKAEEFYSRGVAFTEVDNWELAVREFDKAIELNPDEPLFYNDRGGSHYSLDHIGEALADYSRAIEIDPDYPYAYFNRGMAYRDLELYELAIADFDKYLENNSLESDSDYTDGYIHRGSVHFKLSRFDEAIRDYSTVIEISPTDEETYFLRGVVFSRIGDFSKALEDYSKAIELGYDDPDLLIERSLALNNLKGDSDPRSSEI